LAREKARKHRFNEVSAIAYVLRAEGKRDLINQSIQVINSGDNPYLYIARESMKKKTNRSKFESETNSDFK